MTQNTVDVLVLDLLEWLTSRHRSYEETMDAWRTSCPRLPVWEEAVDRGFVSIAKGHGESAVRVTDAGVQFLSEFRPRSVFDRHSPRVVHD
jgi:hypothetical protein